jgi:hypothetical protein
LAGFVAYVQAVNSFGFQAKGQQLKHLLWGKVDVPDAEFQELLINRYQTRKKTVHGP